MNQEPCQKEREAMEEAQAYLVAIAKTITPSSPVLKKKPPALQAAIRKFDETKTKYYQCLRAQYEKIYGEDWEE